MKYAMKKKMAKGGMVKGIHEQYDAPVGRSMGQSKAGDETRWAQATSGLKSSTDHNKKAKKEHERVLGEMKSMPKPNLMAEGGEVDGNMEDADMIARIMHKRKMYSEGGMVANDDEPIADEMPAQYDDLALRDDLESSYTGANSGDELGNKAMDEEDHDVVNRIMKSRAKKDKMPRPA